MKFFAKSLVSFFILMSSITQTAWGGEKLAGSEWGPGHPDNRFVRFASGGRVFGQGGCNRFLGRYQFKDTGGISIGPLASTKRACASEIMTRERAFIAVLEAAKKYEREAGKLRLFDGKGRQLIELRHRDWD